MEPITVAIADDHKLFLSCFAALVNDLENIEVIMTAVNGKDLLQKLQAKQPDVIMLDVEMPEMDGPQTAAILKVRYPEIRIITITQYDEESLVEYMIKKGARGYLLKDCDPEEIVDAIHSVMRTGYYFNDLISKQTIKRLMKDKEITPLFRKDIQLNERELQILRLICKENTTPEMAKLLNLDKSTVKGYRESLFSKTGATNMIGLVMYAVDNGLLSEFDFDSIRKKPPEIPS